MDHIPFVNSDASLTYTLNWGHLPQGLRITLLILSYLIPISLILWLYMYELRLLSRKMATSLLALRFVVILLILFLVCFKPVFAHKPEDAKRGIVLILVDRSESMDVADPQRTPLEKLRLALSLKLAKDICSDELLEDWIAQHKVGGDMKWVGSQEFQDDPVRRATEENQRRQLHQQVCDHIDKLTRTDVVRRLLFLEKSGLLDGIKAAKQDYEVLFVQTDVQPLHADQLTAFRKEKPKSEEPDEEKEQAGKGPPPRAIPYSTDLAKALQEALQRGKTRKQKIVGVVLLSDGQDNRGGTPVVEAEKLGGEKISLYPIALGNEKPPPDLAVLEILAPPTTFRNVTIPVKVSFKVSAMKEQTIRLKIHRPGEEDKPLETITIEHDGKDQEYQREVPIRLDKKGIQLLQATIEAADKGLKEANGGNNIRSTVINVAADEAKVLLVDGEAGWEYHYLANALLRDRSMNLERVVFTQPRLGALSEKQLREIGNPAIVLPAVEDAEKDPLLDFDCIILGDATPEQLTLKDRKRLERYVAESGGTLVLLAGKRGMPLAFKPLFKRNDSQPEEGPAKKEEDPLIKMLPIEFPQVRTPITGFRFVFTDEGKQTNFLKLEPEGDAEANAKRWESLPRHYWGVTGQAKPGATTLAYLPGEEKDRDKQRQAGEQRQYERDNSLIVKQHYGLGQVLFVGVDSTWRFRYRVGDRYHHRFWSQTIRWAASDKPLPEGNEYLRFGPLQPVYREADPVQIRVRFKDASPDVPDNLKVRARLLRLEADKKEATVAEIALEHPAMQPRILEGKVYDLPPGQYAIEMLIPGWEDRLRQSMESPDKLRSTFTVVGAEKPGEMNNLETNMDLLKAMAAATGKEKVYTVENAREIPELFKPDEKTNPDQPEYRLWQWWLTLVLVLSLLTVEWVARKWAGLP